MKILQFLVMGRTLFDIRSLEDKVGCLSSFDVRKNDVQVCSMLEKSRVLANTFLSYCNISVQYLKSIAILHQFSVQ